MAKIYRTTDIIHLNVDGIKFGVSPLTFEQKMEIQTQMLSGKPTDAMKAAAVAVKCALKKIEGIQDSSGNPYELQFENGCITDQCWDDLQNMAQSQKLTMVCLNLLSSIPEEFIDPATGKRIEGVKRIDKEKPSAKK